MLKAFDRRVLLVTGKGGVGKTVVTAGLAHAAARAGKSVLLCEIGEPDGDYTPLARLFRRDTLPADPETLAANIRGGVLWHRRGHEAFFRSVVPSRTLVSIAMRSDALRRLLETAPSFREMGVFYHAFLHINEKKDDGSWLYDVIIVDMPASGHALGLTGLPERLLSLMPTGPIARALKEGLPWFTEPDKCGAYVVTLPETLPVTEALELVEGLEKTDTPVGGVIVNRVLNDPFTDAERALLDPVLEGKDIYGKGRYEAVAEAEEALQSLRNHTGLPIQVIPEFPLQGEELVNAVANSLATSQEGV